MKRLGLSQEPRQLDLFATNVIQLYLTFPLNSTDRAWMDFQDALKLERERKVQAHEHWKAFMYSIRCMIGQFGYRAFKQGNTIIVERIPYRGYELRHKMKTHKLRVVK